MTSDFCDRRLLWLATFVNRDFCGRWLLWPGTRMSSDFCDLRLLWIATLVTFMMGLLWGSEHQMKQKTVTLQIILSTSYLDVSQTKALYAIQWRLFTHQLTFVRKNSSSRDQRNNVLSTKNNLRECSNSLANTFIPTISPHYSKISSKIKLLHNPNINSKLDRFAGHQRLPPRWVYFTLTLVRRVVVAIQGVTATK